MEHASQPNEPYIEVRDLYKKYATADGSVVRAADNVNLNIASGESVALIGASGSGKSTLLHLISAMDEPDSGTIIVDGTNVTALRGKKRADYRARIGFIFQSFRLIDALTVAQNVSAPLIGRLPAASHQERVMCELEAVGLADRANSYPSQLSGGQQQRVAIARALAVNPALILADEPTGNLDSENSAKIIELLLQIQRERKTTLLVATHDQSLANLLQRVIHIKDGVSTEEAPVTAMGGEQC